ncbi:hypothetical protein BC832DRAFT_279215 [Gaertneriomyces semiglobifer]|nr:hypothetical protein BC832DRAFT_279215 [Gaertneriomyces semiglobifer]
MITTCASVLFSCPSPDMAFWEEAKLKRLPNQLRSTNRMVIRILEALDAADDEMKRFIVRLLHAEAPFYVNDFDRQHAGILLDAGVAKEESGQISIASPYLKTLLLNVVYPDKVITDHEPLPLAPDGSIDLIALVRSSLKYVGAKIGWSKLSANRPGPAEAVIHAELYAALRAIGRKKNMFLTHVEVKQQPGVEQRLDLLLTAQDSPDNFAGFELKVNKLKRSDIINVVERQAERYRQFHSIANMFVVNFVSREHQMDHDMPDQVGAVHCLYVRFDAGFSNVVVTRGNGAPYQ